VLKPGEDRAAFILPAVAAVAGKVGLEAAGRTGA
jgi:hypothetical protein